MFRLTRWTILAISVLFLTISVTAQEKGTGYLKVKANPGRTGVRLHFLRYPVPFPGLLQGSRAEEHGTAKMVHLLFAETFWPPSLVFLKELKRSNMFEASFCLHVPRLLSKIISLMGS